MSKVYTKVVYQLTDKIGEYIPVSEESYEYDGPVAQCGSKTTTTTNSTQSQQYNNTITYDPTSLKQYQSATSTALPILQDYASNPFNNAFFNLSNQMGQKNASDLGSQAIQAVSSQLTQRGINDNSPAAVATMQRQMRMNSGLKANAFLNTMSQAQLNQWNALGLMTNFRPLQTGSSGTSSGQSNSTQVQQTGGLGTWLPQVVGGALGAVGGMASGGMLGGGGFAKTMGSAFGSGAPAPTMGTFSGGSIGGVSAPQLGTPSYMPGGGPSIPAPQYFQ
jgi:hypothetical protein